MKITHDKNGNIAVDGTNTVIFTCNDNSFTAHFLGNKTMFDGRNVMFKSNIHIINVSKEKLDQLKNGGY